MLGLALYRRSALTFLVRSLRTAVLALIWTSHPSLGIVRDINCDPFKDSPCPGMLSRVAGERMV
jgi:hypothetical protein